jgi:DNA-binding CsgD family transcriptional regulator
LLRGEAAQANGWIGRGRRLVEGRDCVERGYLLVPAAEQRLRDGDARGACADASAAVDIGTRFGEPDLAASARHLQGRALIALDETAAGLALLDEAMLAVVVGELTPITTGLLYCSIIAACRQVGSAGRAREWTAAMSRWCDGQPEMLAFTDTCRVDRADVLRLRGEWPEALAEACRACERVHATGTRPPPAAWYQRGEIHRLRGEFVAAEEAYRRASEQGFDPQPGLALLRLAQGSPAEAHSTLQRLLRAGADRPYRARLLPALAEVLLAEGDIPQARAVCDELSAIAEALDTDMLRAVSSQVRGATDLADGAADSALVALRAAFDAWERLQAPYEAARARVLIGLACRALGDQDGARLELAGARACFDRLGAVPDVARAQALIGEPAGGAARRLSPRELDVLRRVAAGATNKAIAAALRLSERTIDRHVSNILDKLDVPSRAAATAYAYRQKLI